MEAVRQEVMPDGWESLLADRVTDTGGDPQHAWIALVVETWRAIKREQTVDWNAVRSAFAELSASATRDSAAFRASCAGLCGAVTPSSHEVQALAMFLLSDWARDSQHIGSVGESAVRLGQTAIERFPRGRGASVAVGLARLCERLALRHEARAAWRRAIEDDPLTPWVIRGTPSAPDDLEEIHEEVASNANADDRRLRTAIQTPTRPGASNPALEAIADERVSPPAVLLSAIGWVEGVLLSESADDNALACHQAERRIKMLDPNHPATGLLGTVLALANRDGDRRSRHANAVASLSRVQASAGSASSAVESAAAVDALWALLDRPDFDLRRLLRECYFDAALDATALFRASRGAALGGLTRWFAGTAIALAVLGGSTSSGAQTDDRRRLSDELGPHLAFPPYGSAPWGDAVIPISITRVRDWLRHAGSERPIDAHESLVFRSNPTARVGLTNTAAFAPRLHDPTGIAFEFTGYGAYRFASPVVDWAVAVSVLQREHEDAGEAARRFREAARAEPLIASTSAWHVPRLRFVPQSLFMTAMVFEATAGRAGHFREFERLRVEYEVVERALAAGTRPPHTPPDVVALRASSGPFAERWRFLEALRHFARGEYEAAATLSGPVRPSNGAPSQGALASAAAFGRLRLLAVRANGVRPDVGEVVEYHRIVAALGPPDGPTTTERQAMFAVDDHLFGSPHASAAPPVQPPGAVAAFLDTIDPAADPVAPTTVRAIERFVGQVGGR